MFARINPSVGQTITLVHVQRGVCLIYPHALMSDIEFNSLVFFGHSHFFESPATTRNKVGSVVSIAKKIAQSQS